jgi:hypothetical protein
MRMAIRGTLAVLAGFAAMAATVAAFKLFGNVLNNAVAGGVGFIGFVIACIVLPKPKPRQEISN